MKPNKQLILITALFIGLASYGQESLQDKVEQLVQHLNSTIAPKIQVKKS